MPEPIACTLGAGDQDRRVGEWRDLLGRATAREPVPDGLRFSLPASLAGTAAELAAAEQRCCPFFRFTMVFGGGEVQLTVEAPLRAARCWPLSPMTPARPWRHNRHELRRRGRPGPLVRRARVG